MPTLTQELEDLIRKYLEEDQGETAREAVVKALAIVGTGHIETSAGTIASTKTVKQQLAAALVERYLRGTRPSPGNNYLTAMSQLITSRLAAEKPPVTAPKGQIAALAALALGSVTSMMIPAARTFSAMEVARLYLEGRP